MYNLTKMLLAQKNAVEVVGIALLVIVILVAFVFLMLFLKFFRLWLQAKLSRADVKEFGLSHHIDYGIAEFCFSRRP